MELTVYSRSNNHELWLKMREFIPAHIDCIEVTGFDHWRDASNYLYHIIENAKTKYIVNIDIDAFVIDWRYVETIISNMAINNYTHCGMSESNNDCSHRNGSHTTMNPFFNVFNSEKVSQLIHAGGCSDEIDFIQPNEGLGESRIILNSEPFHGLFNLLYMSGKPMYINSVMHYDGIANILKYKSGLPFLIHTWYSREYGINPEQTERIDYFYEQAKRMQVK